MRVLVNCLSLRSGGAVAYLRNLLPLLSPELDRRNAQLIALTRSDQQHLVPDSIPGNQVVVVPSAQVEGEGPPIIRALPRRRTIHGEQVAGTKITMP